MPRRAGAGRHRPPICDPMTVFPPCLTRPNAREAVSGEISKGMISTRSRGCFALRISALSLFPRQIDRPVCPPKCIGRGSTNLCRGPTIHALARHMRARCPDAAARVRRPGHPRKSPALRSSRLDHGAARFCETASSVTIADSIDIHDPPRTRRALPECGRNRDRLLQCDTGCSAVQRRSVRRMDVHGVPSNRLTGVDRSASICQFFLPIKCARIILHFGLYAAGARDRLCP